MYQLLKNLVKCKGGGGHSFFKIFIVQLLDFLQFMFVIVQLNIIIKHEYILCFYLFFKM